MRRQEWVIFFCGTILFLGFFANARAGAWAQPKGHGLTIMTYVFYTTDQQFGDGWTLESFSDSGRFTKNEWNLYVEYGLFDRVTLVGNFFLDALAYQNN